MKRATGQNTVLVDNLRINVQKNLDLGYTTFINNVIFSFVTPSLSHFIYILSLYSLQHECDLLSGTEQTRGQNHGDLAGYLFLKHDIAAVELQEKKIHFHYSLQYIPRAG
jgi:hypothetical protein